MNPEILHPSVQKYIHENADTNLNKLILKGSPFAHISVQEIAQQIEGKKKTKTKLPLWFETAKVYYPPKINLEQCSSHATAVYKSNLITGKNCIDLTGGFGVDSYYFSKKFEKLVHCELNPTLSKIAQHNHQLFLSTNIDTVEGDSLAFLKKTTLEFDWIYVDPSRRNDTKGKVFLLEDCLPNIPKNLDFLFECSPQILIKNSPMLDIQRSLKELKFIKEIHVVAVQNEVKELLFSLKKDFHERVHIKTINITREAPQYFSFFYRDETAANYSEPKCFLYEPNAAILKSGAFQQVATQFKINKIHQHSHLYTSDVLIAHFPGRIFKIKQQLKYDKKTLLKHLPSKKANITTRNFPETVAQIRKKTKLKDGGEEYLFFTTDLNENKIVLLCQKTTL